METRIIYSDNATLSDITSNVNDYYSSSETIDMVAAEDYIFIGSYFPFNNFYVKMGSTLNANASVMTVEYWDGTTFRAVADLIDETDASGATLGQSGHVIFVPHKKYSWVREDTVDINDNEEITGLGNVKLYERYWIRISVSADLTASTDLKWIGTLFNKDDNKLEGLYPELSTTKAKTAYESGKTDWQEQRVLAAEEIIKDLKKSNIILDKGQILEIEDFSLAEVHKSAALIYSAFGDSRETERSKASSKYKNSLDGFSSTIDKNRNARSDSTERTTKSSHGFR